MNNIFSFFKAPIYIEGKALKKSVIIEQAYTIIISEQYKQLCEQLQSLKTEKEQREFKAAKFDFFTFSGTFKYRAEAGLIERSIYICLDFDHVGGPEQLKKLIARILEHLTPVLMFVSPRGEGLKVVVCVNPDEAEHKEYFAALERLFNEIVLQEIMDTNNKQLRVDPSGKDIPRPCFLSYDPQAFKSDTPTIFDRALIDTFSGIGKSNPGQPHPEQTAETLEQIEQIFLFIRDFHSGNYPY
ncbi:MAG: hypothetical protein HY840_12620 [Bacteroidetes bacterium]|nr:hypothetical protein [Bacteroidota bacterium]